MEDWHEENCRRPDLLTFEDLESCLNCGASRSKSLSVQGQYSYEPLRSETHIRLLTLFPGIDDDPIAGKLSLTSLSDDQEYSALSYTWADETGNQDFNSSMLVNGHAFPITSNCLAVLKRVRRSYTSVLLWVDAICIDQQNDLEKNHQVRIMPQIYARAVSVLVYAGGPVLHETQLLEFLKSSEPFTQAKKEVIETFRELFARRWFSRVWVLQEVILSQSALLMCGSLELSWSSIHSRCLAAIQGPDVNTKRRFDELPAIFEAKRMCEERPVNLFKLLDLARLTNATDPRDKIFALLGFILEAEKDGFEADYTKTTQEVYMRAAESMASKCGMFSLLGRFCLLYRDTSSNALAVKKLPLWVPSWTQQLVGVSGLRDAVLESLWNETPLTTSIPIQVDCSNQTIEFPVCEIEFDNYDKSHDENPELFFGTDLIVFTREGDERKDEIVQFWITRTDLGSDSWQDQARVLYVTTSQSSQRRASESRVSIYLLPQAGGQESIDFPYGSKVSIVWDVQAEAVHWAYIENPKDFRSGYLSPYALCAVHEHGTIFLWGMIHLGNLGTPRMRSGHGVFKTVKLTADLGFELYL